ncbi:hypothetical protein HPB47_007562, partial [Ixodes persulcatus]
SRDENIPFAFDADHWELKQKPDELKICSKGTVLAGFVASLFVLSALALFLATSHHTSKPLKNPPTVRQKLVTTASTIGISTTWVTPSSKSHFLTLFYRLTKKRRPVHQTLTVQTSRGVNIANKMEQGDCLDEEVVGRILLSSALLATQKEEHQAAKKHRRRRQRWLRPCLRDLHRTGRASCLLPRLHSSNMEYYRELLRMHPRIFDTFLSLVGLIIKKEETRFRIPITPDIRDPIPWIVIVAPSSPEVQSRLLDQTAVHSEERSYAEFLV